MKHHNHLKEFKNFLGALCNRCNLQIKTQGKLIILSHYASYEIANILKYASSRHKFQVLTQKSRMKYYSLTINGVIDIIDSNQFLKSSLDKLIKQFLESNEPHIFNEVICNRLAIDKNSDLYSYLVVGKMQMFYDYIDHISILEQTQFPSHDKFYNNLRERHISVKEYNDSKLIYELYGCKNIGDYYELYCLLDTIFLADVFISWRDMMFQEYELDVSQYLTLPSFSFDAMLKFKYMENSNFTIELISDVHLSSLISHNIRGGFCTLTSHYEKLDDLNKLLLNMTKSNKKRLRNKVAISTIDYLDVNSNYPGVMLEPLPIGDFHEATPTESKRIIVKFKKNEFDFSREDRGYFCYVTLKENSKQVQDSTDQLPFCLQNVQIGNEQLSDFTLNRMGEKQRNNPLCKYSRLSGHHFTKNKQLYDAQSLQLALKKGIKIKEIHGIYSFKQEPFLKKFILNQIEKRKSSKNTMESSMYKLISNSIFGKFLCNAMNYSTTTYVCHDKYKFTRRLCKENFIDYTMVNDTRALVHTRKSKIKLKMPNYIGFSILEKSRRVMRVIFYDIILEILNKNSVSLIYSDTDSLIIRYNLYLEEYSEKEYFKEKMEILRKLKNEHVLDTSNFPKTHPLYDNRYKSSLFRLKSEIPKYIIGELTCLAPKVYQFSFINYHINKIIYEIKEYIETCFKTRDLITHLFSDISSCIFEIDLSLEELEISLINLNIELEGYHNVKIKYMNYQDERKPQSSSFYNEDVLNSINVIRENSNKRDNVFFIDMDSNFNIFIYKYFSELISRPMPDKIMRSDAELMAMKSKTCSGIPAFKFATITEMDYKNALKQRREEIKRITYNIMVNVNGTYKTINTEKICLRNHCVKRFFKNENTSFSFGHRKIPENKRNNFRFEIKEEIDCDPPLTSNSESSDSSTSSDSEENTIDENLTRFNSYDIFSIRRKKHETIFR